MLYDMEDKKMKIKTFVIESEHLDEVIIGRVNKVKSVLASEFYRGYSGERFCRLVCEVK